MIDDRKTGLFLTRAFMEGHTYLNIGRELSAALQNETPDSPSFSIKAYDTLRRILTESVKTDADGTPYIAITNYAILFEPTLKINLRAVVQDFSKRYLLILHLDSPLVDSMTYYPFPEDKNYRLDLTEIPHTTIG